MGLCPRSVVESYSTRRDKYIRALRCVVGGEAEDVLHDAVEVMLARERDGIPINWRVAFRRQLWTLQQRRQRIDVGLPLDLPDAACLAETIDRRRRLAIAQRVLTASELDLLLQEYESAPSATMSCIRIARRKLRLAR